MFRSLHYVQASQVQPCWAKQCNKCHTTWKKHETCISLKISGAILRWQNSTTGWKKAKAQKMMKVTSLEPKLEDNSTATTKTKTAIKVFALTSKADGPTIEGGILPSQPVKYTACKETHPLWRWPVLLRKTPTQRGESCCCKQILHFVPKVHHSFRHCPKSRNCTAEGCSSSHNVLLHAAEKVFSL